jgi:hypothetical protein
VVVKKVTMLEDVGGCFCDGTADGRSIGQFAGEESCDSRELPALS